MARKHRRITNELRKRSIEVLAYIMEKLAKGEYPSYFEMCCDLDYTSYMVQRCVWYLNETGMISVERDGNYNQYEINGVLQRFDAQSGQKPICGL